MNDKRESESEIDVKMTFNRKSETKVEREVFVVLATRIRRARKRIRTLLYFALLLSEQAFCSIFNNFIDEAFIALFSLGTRSESWNASVFSDSLDYDGDLLVETVQCWVRRRMAAQPMNTLIKSAFTSGLICTAAQLRCQLSVDLGVFTRLQRVYRELNCYNLVRGNFCSNPDRSP